MYCFEKVRTKNDEYTYHDCFDGVKSFPDPTNPYNGYKLAALEELDNVDVQASQDYISIDTESCRL